MSFRYFIVGYRVGIVLRNGFEQVAFEVDGMTGEYVLERHKCSLQSFNWDIAMTDGELVCRVIAGETAAYGELTRRWYCRILAYCHSRLFCRNQHDAEDLAQDVFIRGFGDLTSLQDPDSFGPWLRGIANHACSDWGREKLRGVAALKRAEPERDSSSTRPLEEVANSDERALVMKQIALMPEDLREVVLLHYYEELTYDEMARWLGVARATVNERLAKARGMLRTRLAKLRSDV